MDICTVSFTAENEGIQREKAALKFHFWQKTRFTDAIAPSKRANSLNLETDLNLLTITFHLPTEQSYTSFINSWWKWVMLSVRPLTVFKKKFPWQTLNLSLFAKPVVVVFFFLKRACTFVSYTLSTLQVPGCDRYLLKKKSFKVCLEAF